MPSLTLVLAGVTHCFHATILYQQSAYDETAEQGRNPCEHATRKLPGCSGLELGSESPHNTNHSPLLT
ncbi:MAG TPA: hypothetical protein VF598_02685, partial [Hymenobacter sp.]